MDRRDHQALKDIVAADAASLYPLRAPLMAGVI